MRFLYTFHEYIKKNAFFFLYGNRYRKETRFSFYMDIIPEQTGHKRFRPDDGNITRAKPFKFLLRYSVYRQAPFQLYLSGFSGSSYLHHSLL